MNIYVIKSSIHVVGELLLVGIVLRLLLELIRPTLTLIVKLGLGELLVERLCSIWLLLVRHLLLPHSHIHAHVHPRVALVWLLLGIRSKRVRIYVRDESFILLLLLLVQLGRVLRLTYILIDRFRHT